ncbi:MAG: methyltransferase domain-containing protein [Hyphomicrobiaceae bacterium]
MTLHEAKIALPLTLQTVQGLMSRHIPLYRTHAPTYQLMLLQSLRGMWNPAHKRVLDVGGGTGIIAQAISDLFGVGYVTSVDVEDRFLKTLDIETRVYDGTAFPFDDASFDCVTLSNVMHHVPPLARPGLMRECARVTGGGPIYIKDHVAASRLDHVRLFVLDALGNVPFGGMVKASYLSDSDWQRLAGDCGYRIDSRTSGVYRAGAFERVFPNGLETTMRLVRP